MRAAVIDEYGGPEVVRVRDIPEPVPGPNEVAVSVRYAAMNFTDVRNRMGDGLGQVPFVPGVEVAGLVRALGPGVEGFAVGQPVAALTRGQAHAEVAVAPAGLTVALTEDLAGRPESGAALVTVPVALMLVRAAARVRPGETVLVHGAAGGVGTVAAQLSALDGLLPFFGVAGTEARAAFARTHGYDDVFTYSTFAEAVLERTRGRGVDVVLDPIGGAVRADSFEVLAPFGRLVCYSNVSRAPERAPDTEWLRARCISYAGLSVGQLSGRSPEVVRPFLEDALRLVAAGELDVGVQAVLPLDQVAEAHRRFDERSVEGKIVLAVGP